MLGETEPKAPKNLVIQILAASALVLASVGQTLQEEQLRDGNTIVIMIQIHL